MRRINGSDRIRPGSVELVTFVLLTAPASAAIVAIDAEAATAVQELIDGAPASITADDVRLSDDGSTLPLVASAELTSTDLSGAIVSLAQAFSEFSDPGRLDQPNPEEFAVEVACYSNARAVSYSVFGDATEARTVLFARGEDAGGAGEIDFGAEGTAEIESRVFVSGAVILWSTDSRMQLEGLRAELHILVTGGDADEILLESMLFVSGSDSGQVKVTATGPVQYEAIGLDELAEFGLDEETLMILQRIEDAGELVVLVLPMQEHAYTYTAAADEGFPLTARLEIHIQNIPGGTGVAATLGRPFEELVDFIELGLPGVDGETMQRSVNLAAARRGSGVVAPSATAPRPRTGLACGAFGFESAGVLLSLTLVGTARRVRLRS